MRLVIEEVRIVVWAVMCTTSSTDGTPSPIPIFSLDFSLYCKIICFILKTAEIERLYDICVNRIKIRDHQLKVF